MAGEKEDWSQGGEVWGGVQTPGDKGGWVGLVCCPCPSAAGLSSGTVTLALPHCDGEGHAQSYHITPPFALVGCLVLAPA